MIRPYTDADRDAVIALFRQFMAELTPPGREAEFAAYVEQAIREELSRIGEYYRGAFWVMDLGGVVGMAGIERQADETSGYRYLEAAAPAGTTHKRVGGLQRFYFEKRL